MRDLDNVGTPDDLVGFLADCHEGIRRHAALARMLVDADSFSADALSRTALRVRRYFERVVPLHLRDEEDSLLPRLRGLDPALDRELSRRAREHRDYSRAVAALVAACEEVVRVPIRLTRVLPYVGRIAAELEAHFAERMAYEESVIFPAIGRYLDAPSITAAMIEIHRRWLGPGVELRVG